MKVLIDLSLLKVKAKVRNLFAKKSSAIVLILCVLFYGGCMFMALTVEKNPVAMMSALDKHGVVMMAVGYTALMVFSMLFQKRKALLFAEDSFYLFKGPFTQRQILLYATFTTIGISFLYGLLTVFVVVCLSMSNTVSIPLMIAIGVSTMLCVMIWSQFNDGIYLYSLVSDRFKKMMYELAYLMLGLVALLLAYEVYINDFEIGNALKGFLIDDAFYYIPCFGQMKLALIGVMESNFSYICIGFGTLFGLYLLSLWFFTMKKPDFYEEALADSEEFSNYYKEVKSGSKSTFDLRGGKIGKIKDSSFMQGAKAIFSKNILLMKRGGTLIRKQELLIIVIYFGIAIVIDNSFEMFLYMLYIFLFFLLQDCDLLKELKNYQIYLIPDSAFRKLFYALLPSLLKISLIACISILLSGLYFGLDMESIVLNIVQIEGYIMVFLSASALSLRLMKSRTNRIVENVIRIMILIASALPGICLTFYLLFEKHVFEMHVYEWISYGSLVLNFVVAFILLYFSKGMMNGCDIQSE